MNHNKMYPAIFILLISLILFAPAGSGQTDNLDGMKTAFNERSTELPGILDFVIGHQKVNVHINQSTGGNETAANETFAFEVRGRNMTKIGSETYDDPTVDIWMTDQALVSVLQADNPQQEIGNQMEQENIDYAVYGFVNKIRVAVIKFVL